MAARTKLGLLNSRSEDTPLNITDNAHEVTASDVSNGIVICDFFEAVEDTASLILTNPGAGAAVIVIKTGTGTAGNADGTAVTDTVFDKTISVAAGKTVTLPITNSSRYGQPNLDAASNRCMGLYINPATSADTYNLTIAAKGKYRAGYTGATLS